MKSIRQIIEDNRNEFEQLIEDFIVEKTEEIEKKPKAPKTICHFTTLGKTFNSNKFVENYENFLHYISALPLPEEIYYKALGTFVTDDLSTFPTSYSKSGVIHLPNNLKVSTYSSTERKMEHIAKLGDNLNLHIDFKIL